MNSNIFQIEQKYLDIIEELELNDGELTPELAEELAVTEEERDNKLDAYIKVIRQKQADIGLAKDEIDRLKDVINSNNKLIDRLKGIMVGALEAFHLVNKSGNLSHRLPSGLIYTRKVSSVDVKIEEFDYGTLQQYEDVCEVVIKTKLTKGQLDKIMPILEEEDENHVTLDFNVIPSKEKFKQMLIAAANIEDDDERANAYERLEEFAEIDEKYSLIIR